MVLRGMVLRGMVLYKENDGGRMVWIGFAGWLVLGLVKKKKKKMLDGVFFGFGFVFRQRRRRRILDFFDLTSRWQQQQHGTSTKGDGDTR